MNSLNKTLYRGDGDHYNQRELKTILKQSLVRTNMAGGGIGREIFEQPLIACIQDHVNGNWKKTHFLSFSEDINRAISFGKGKDNQDRDHEIFFDPDDVNSDKWDFLILTLTGQKLEDFQKLKQGVYSCCFIPGTKAYLPRYPIILMDVVQILSGHPPRTEMEKKALENAKRDKEWLLLPALAHDFGGSVEYRGYLDCRVFTEIETFSLVKDN